MTIAWRRGRLSAAVMPSKAIGIGLLAGLFLGLGYVSSPRRSIADSTTAPTSASAGVPSVRVRILSRIASVQINVDGTPQAISAADVTAARTFDPISADKPIAVDGHRYRGQIRLVPNGATASPSTSPAATLDVINIVSIDDYLRGVVPSEMYSKWPLDALKAQAIAARTYAIYRLKSREADKVDDVDPDAQGRGFDLHADVRSQAYKGVDNEAPSATEAVDSTRGVVLASGDAGAEKIFPAFFSNTCGGTSASGADVFDEPVHALAEHTSAGCVDAPRYRWPEFSIAKDELTRRLRVWGTRQNASLASCGLVKSVDVLQRNPLGRPTRFVITDDAGKRFVLPSEQFRNACNADGPKDVQFLSSFFTPIDAGDSIRITDGRGWGHGVGLCQYCALGWAKKGQDYRAILSQSYPGAVLVRAY